MTVKDDAKFKRKLSRGFNNDMWNLVNFHASSQRSEYLPFNEIVLSKTYKVLDEKVQKFYISWHGRVMQSVKRNLGSWFP